MDRIFIPSRYIFFSKSPTVKNSRVKRIGSRAISEWVLVYNPTGLAGVETVRPGVIVVL
jgi:hypothetical protein